MPDMSLAMAKQIIETADKHGGIDGDYKTYDDERTFKEAVELVQVVRQSYDNGVRSDAVLEVLFDALVEPVADYVDVYKKFDSAKLEQVPAPQPEEAPAQTFNPNTQQMEPNDSQLAAAPAQADIEAIVEGYDDYKVKDLQQAIITAAAEGDLSPDEWEQIKLYEQSTEERKSILELQPEFKAPEPEIINGNSPPGVTPAPADPNEHARPGAAGTDYGSSQEMEQAYNDGSLGHDQIGIEGLPIPPAPNGDGSDEPILPVDITQASDGEISRLMMQFNSLEARALWLVSQEEGRRDVAAVLRQNAHADAYSRALGQYKAEIEKETASALENARSQARHAADNDDMVVTWRNRETRHGIEARSVKALAEGWEKSVARLSREMTRRQILASGPSAQR